MFPSALIIAFAVAAGLTAIEMFVRYSDYDLQHLSSRVCWLYVATNGAAAVGLLGLIATTGGNAQGGQSAVRIIVSVSAALAVLRTGTVAKKLEHSLTTAEQDAIHAVRSFLHVLVERADRQVKNLYQQRLTDQARDLKPEAFGVYSIGSQRMTDLCLTLSGLEAKGDAVKRQAFLTDVGNVGAMTSMRDDDRWFLLLRWCFHHLGRDATRSAADQFRASAG